MKKILLTMLGVAGILCSTSCSDEEIVSNVEGDAVAEFTVELSDGSDASRAISDGLTVSELYYEVYSVKNGVATLMPNLDAKVTLEKVAVDGKDVRRANVSLALVKGQAYDVVFWAQTQGAYDATDLRNIAVNQKENANNEAKDAFTAVYRTAKVTGPIKETIKLYRPFAQINFGTPATDIAAARAAGATIAQSEITVTGVATSYDALAEEGKGSKDSFTFELGDIQEGETLTVGTETYKYLATAYVLYPGKAEDQATSDLTMRVPTGLNQDVVLTVPTAPVQRNYRTNVLGNLLTNTADFNIVVDPIYNTPDNIETVWDGKATVKPQYDEQTKTYSVGTAEELAWIANLVNGTLPAEARSEVAKAENLSGQTVKLTADINLAGQEWTPIGIGSNRFHGTIDGNGYGIYNLTVTQRHGNYSQAALVGNVAGTVAFRDLTIKNATIKCPDYNDDFYGAAVVGTMYGNVTFDNVKVEDSYISGNNKVAALVAHDGVCSSLNINNCHVSGVTFEALNVEDGGSVGGLVGYFQGTATGEHKVVNSTVNGCTFNVVNSTNSGKRANGQLIGGIDSKAGQELVIENCSVANNTWNEKFYENGVEVAETERYVSPYGSLIGGERDDIPQGEVIIDNKTFIADGVLQDNAGEYYAVNAVGLSYLNAKMVDKSLGKNAVVNIDADIDFTGYTWTPVDSHADTKFTLAEINGNGHTISNLTINGQAMFTRFAGSGDVVIKDLTFDNANVNSNGKINTSILTVQSYQNVLLDNVDVKNSTISGGYKVAPLIATVYNESSSTVTATLKNCDVENCTVKATTYDFCTTGMVAFVYADDNDKIEFENCTVKNVKLIAPNDSYKAHAAIYTTGSGSLYNEAEGVVVENVTFEAL